VSSETWLTGKKMDCMRFQVQVFIAASVENYVICIQWKRERRF